MAKQILPSQTSWTTYWLATTSHKQISQTTRLAFNWNKILQNSGAKGSCHFSVNWTYNAQQIKDYRKGD